ncbi:MAG: hypothetical protein WCK77_24390 [Verrucomicrobiota bacterium]
MSFYNLYVGDASDPTFHWDGGDFSGNIPKIILDLGGLGLFGCVEARNLLESPKYGGRVLDWGASGARLNKARILEFVSEYLQSGQHCVFTLRRLQTLEDDREYILLACEQ